MDMLNKNIIIYGLSAETERMLNEWNGKYHVIGLLDGFRTSGEEFGYPILDINDVVRLEDITIVVIARPGSCKAIAKRIGDICRDNNIPLFDIRGNDLLLERKVVYDFTNINGYTKSDLIEQIKNVDVVSFDLFDTLVVRDVLSSSDVIELVNARLVEKGIEIPDFVSKRIGTEKLLSKDRAPRLKQIYEEVLKNIRVENIQPDELVELEYKIEKNLLRPRTEMRSIILEAKKLGKKVFLTSESYYSKKQIAQILEENCIEGVDQLFVSCEYDTPKTALLFDVMAEASETRNILHIGDDLVADIESARKHGLKAFQIYSASELMDLVGGLGITGTINCLSDRVRVGLFVSKLFNNPFVFEDDKCAIHVDDVKDVGGLFCAPIFMDFVSWFEDMVEKNNFRNVWLGARDGYLIQKLYGIMYPYRNTTYYLTSRISAVRAGMKSVEDISYVDEMKYSGGLSDNLKTRFGINVTDIPDEAIDYEKDGLLRYASTILDVSKTKRTNNLRYIDNVCGNDDSIAFFDFVAKGTCQLYIQKLVSNPITGLYFMQLEPEYMASKGIDISSFYTEAERETSAIFDNYYILETILTSPDPSVDEFNADGTPVFSTETRTESDIECFMRAQEGIIEYVERYISICPKAEIKISKTLDEAMLKLIHNIEIRDNNFLKLTVEDPFFCRMTDITDVL